MEKKLTDEEIIKALACMTGVQLRDCNDCSFKDGNLCDDFKIARNAIALIHRLQAENERLTEENGYLDGCAKQFLADYQKCEIERAEIQKRVDELTQSNKELTVLIRESKYYQLAVKDTAKEIYEWLMEHPIDDNFINIKKHLKEKYGVEVER